MSSLFHRRTRSASAQRPKTPVSSSAHMAATQAFLANRASQSNLSASAAATALRTMSPPPINVSDVQTKRMQRRSSSASLTNASRGRGRGGLERRDSAGSMTERTFRRSPSPGHQENQPAPERAPPVPKLPSNVVKPPPIPAKSHRRTASLEAPPARVASPTMNRMGGRGQSAQPASYRSPQTNAAALVMRQHRPAELERPESRNSINFSYPRPMSPPPRSPASPEPQTPVMRNSISAAEAERVQYGVTQVAQQPVKKKKKKVAPQAAEGSHLSTGSMGGRPVTAPLPPGPSVQPQPLEQPVQKKKKKPAAATGQTSHFPPSPASTQDSDSDSTPEKARRLQRASGTLNKQPSVVKEDWEGEQQQEYGTATGQRHENESLSPIYENSKTVKGKKPLTAANMSRKIEEPASPTFAEPPLAFAHHAVTESQPPQPLQNKLLLVEGSQHQRVSSLSPSRSTRFSDKLASDLAAGQKHSPLPRSVSPAKSAMKHHDPSGGSPADPSIPRVRGSSTTPSDASDSNMSADGSVRRKKSARVSFQPEVEIAGTAAEVPDTDSPTVYSPQHKEQGRRGLFGRSKPVLTTIPSQEEIDGHMQPRPQLPFFGSIRGKTPRSDSSDSVGAATAERKAQLLPPVNIASATSTSSEASSSSYRGADRGVSSDHAIGSIFARDAQKNAYDTSRNPNLPLPPQVTSVEGSGEVSDTESENSAEDREIHTPAVVHHVDQTKPLIPSTVVPLPTSANPVADKGIPQLALHPPTPGTEQDNPTDQWAIEVPGGFPASTEELPSTAALVSNKTPTGLGIAEPPSTPTGVSKLLEQKPTSDLDAEASDHDSIYSDAAEDLSDLEGDGFGSIDAVVESPVVDSPRPRITSPPSSPLAERPQEGSRTTSWDDTQQRWSGIAQQTRQATALQPPAVQKVPAQSATGALPQPKKKKKKSAAAIAAGSAPIAVMAPALNSSPKAKNQPSPYPMIDTTNQTSLRQSMRGPPPRSQNEAPAFRQSLRSPPAAQPDHGFRQSMRAQPTAMAAPVARSRPQSMPQPPPSPPTQMRATLQKKHIPPATGVPKPAATKQAAQPFSNDSDSESSFRKSRRSKSSGGAFTMRTSMRAGPSDGPSQPGGRGAVRSLSPPQRRPFSPPPEQKAFRSTMRTSMETSAPTLRGPLEQKRSSSLFGRKTKSPVRAQPVAVKPGIRSRIAEDSDDDDEPRKPSFKSRINDSSDDEDDTVGLRPVRGIPRRGDDGDSTDLEDSSDDEQRSKKPQPPPKINTAVAAAPITDAPLSPNIMKKKGLFSRFRSKKVKDEPSKSRPGVSTIGDRNTILERTTSATKAARNDDDDEEAVEGGSFENMGFGSAAERDAMIALTMAKLEAAKAPASTQPEPQPLPEISSSVSGSVVGSAPGTPATPATSATPATPPAGRLQRRMTPQRFASDSWPLPPKIGALDEDQRPSTADAIGTRNGSALRPGIGDRVPTSETMKTENGTPIFGRTGKKKRFPLLRKAFGLKD